MVINIARPSEMAKAPDWKTPISNIYKAPDSFTQAEMEQVARWILSICIPLKIIQSTRAPWILMQPNYKLQPRTEFTAPGTESQ